MKPAVRDTRQLRHSLLDQPPDTLPITRLAREARTDTRTVLRGKPTEVADTGVRKALRDTIFRFELIVRINIVAHDMIEREALLYMVFAGQIAMLASEDRKQRRDDADYLRRLAGCRDLCFARVNDLLATAEARSTAEGRSLDGGAALFPDAVASWAERLQLLRELAVSADRIAGLDGVKPLVPPGEDRAGRVTTLLADLIEPARSTALDKLDEGRQALAIATDWLRSKAIKPVQAVESETTR